MASAENEFVRPQIRRGFSPSCATCVALKTVVPSGYLAACYGKIGGFITMLLIGKSTINGPCSIAM